MSQPTPSYSHLKSPAYRDVYEPAEDSFLFMDALEQEAGLLHKLRPLICLEVGSGSGVILAFLARLLRAPSFLWAVDINLAACEATKETLMTNCVSLPGDVLCMDLISCFTEKLKGKVDVLLFNPPYVVTPSEEVIDRCLPHVPELLTPNGFFYLMVTKENRPDDICKVMCSHGLASRTVLSRRAKNEQLSVLRFSRNS